ncbi:STAS domain-containing protein [Frankia sp. CNm7]|uniref:STAS domain-containing protein n=1 Tax=Frankia nepalensis TaxID=1836974 RepID=A0A937ULF2_9ACTN|nr:STAS domain-containing protein [Frankia nepalensis]MBL7495332.1 STAS domain-containing protein [Frankia nepalensis]MBL7513282.1 STAS domain-containing protein [Frankia nepalensis]MBL7519370.1 STAS domain-containing protein [Frankia nepalensis]MBL7627779.1 STAS domain-containing protein [Frankia nepalensis]
MRVDGGALRMSVHRDAGEDVLLELVGELDDAGRRCLRDQIGELLGRGGGTVTVDVGGLRQIDIPALAALLRADLLLRRVHGTLEIRAPTPAFLELVAATGLTDRLRIVPATGSSVASTGSPPVSVAGVAGVAGVAPGRSA